ncbi:MAG: FMN-binding negative transcriptional regulator [Pseudomonadota bacterium]
MIFYDYYADVPDDVLREFVSRQELGRFVTANADGQPHIGLYPFLLQGERIEIHLHRNDEQLADLLSNKKCTFEVDEIHGAIPSHWIHATNAMFATAYHRVVIFECDAEVSADAVVLAAQQQRLMAHYQPEGGHAPVSAEQAMYRGPFKEIRALTLSVRARKVKWKLAQNRTREQRENLIAELRKRGRPSDAGAADALQWTLDHEAHRSPR